VRITALILLGPDSDQIHNCKLNRELMSLSFIEPMKALPVQELPAGNRLYEIKFDGYRALAFKDGKDVRLVSRNKKAFSIIPSCSMH
jgi:ATP-dependent DNA ligase